MGARLTAEQEERLAYNAGKAFYGWFFVTLCAGLLFLWWAHASYGGVSAVEQAGVRVAAVAWTAYTTFIGVVAVIFVAFAAGAVAAMLVVVAGNPASEDFWSVPVRIVDDEHETLMADEIISRHEAEEKKKRKLKRALKP